MDKFTDDLEGISAEHIKTDFFINKTANPVKDFNLSVPDPRSEELNADLEGLKLKKAEYQKSVFVSCWYLHQRESLAMWNLYSNRDSVVLKIDYQILCKALESEVEKQVGHLPEVQKFISGKVRYRDIINHNPLSAKLDSILGRKQKGLEVRYKAFRKDESYRHENEYRFCIAMGNSKRNEPYCVTLNGIPDSSIQIVFHPQMDIWKKENIKTLVAKLGLSYKFCDSEITKWLKP
jgi:hypothetical protein